MNVIIDTASLGFQRRMKKTDYVFDATNPNFFLDVEHSETFIQSIQNYCNHRLHFDGFFFLNDVLRSLGLPLRDIGQIVGWTVNGLGFVKIEITQRKFNGTELVKMSLKIKPEEVVLLTGALED